MLRNHYEDAARLSLLSFGLMKGDQLLSSSLVERYMRILNVPAAKPSFEHLRQIVTAHLTGVPFENISKLYYRKRFGLLAPPAIELYLDGLEHNHFGGTCYANNSHLYSLLASLGYDARLCGADMSKPDVHVVIIVTIHSREYIVDGGYAAPLLSPMPRDLKDDYVIALGRDRYVLKPQDASHRSTLELYRDGVLKHGYRVNPAPRSIDEFTEVINVSFLPASVFLNAILLTRFYPGRFTVIHNFNVIESHGTESRTTKLSSADDLIGAIEHHFGIPRDVTADALNELPLRDKLVDVWG